MRTAFRFRNLRVESTTSRLPLNRRSLIVRPFIALPSRANPGPRARRNRAVPWRGAVPAPAAVHARLAVRWRLGLSHATPQASTPHGGPRRAASPARECLDLRLRGGETPVAETELPRASDHPGCTRVVATMARTAGPSAGGRCATPERTRSPQPPASVVRRWA